MTLGFTNVTDITACTSKLVNHIGLQKFRERVFTIEKTSNFNSENITTILLFLQYLSEICLSFILKKKKLINLESFLRSQVQSLSTCSPMSSFIGLVVSRLPSFYRLKI